MPSRPGQIRREDGAAEQKHRGHLKENFIFSKILERMTPGQETSQCRAESLLARRINPGCREAVKPKEYIYIYKI